jgi:glutaredoxin
MNYAVITRDNCIWCTKVKNLLKEYSDTTVFEYNLSQEPVLLDFMKAAGFKTVPVVFQKGNIIGGYEETKAYLEGVKDEHNDR